MVDTTTKKSNSSVEEFSLLLESHSDSIVDIITVDKEHIVSLSVDNTAKYWSIASKDFGRLIQTITSTCPTKMFCLSDKRLLIPNYDNSISVYNSKLKPADPLLLLGHNSWCINYCELHDKRLATCSRDKTVKIWSMKTNECDITLEGHTDIVNSIIQTKDQLLISSSSDCTIKVWMLYEDDEYECLSTLVDGVLPVFQIELLDKDTLISRSESPLMKAWKYKLGQKWMIYKGHVTNVICLIVLNDQRIASGSYDKTIKIWNKKSDREDASLVGHTFTVFALKQMTNGNLLSGSGDHTVKYWDLKTYECLKTFVGHTDFVISLGLINQDCFVSGSYDSSLRVWMVDE